MGELLNEVCQDGMSLSGGKHTLRLEIASAANLFGNRDELRSAFGNLLSNAIRYTPRAVRFIRWFERGGQPVFSVQDSGIGISAQHIPRLTERFYRVDRSRSRATGGTGLGLAIVKHIALRHQARLEVLSEEDKGSTFSLVFLPTRRRSSRRKADPLVIRPVFHAEPHFHILFFAMWAQHLHHLPGLNSRA